MSNDGVLQANDSINDGRLDTVPSLDYVVLQLQRFRLDGVPILIKQDSDSYDRHDSSDRNSKRPGKRTNPDSEQVRKVHNRADSK